MIHVVAGFKVLPRGAGACGAVDIDYVRDRRMPLARESGGMALLCGTVRGSDVPQGEASGHG